MVQPRFKRRHHHLKPLLASSQSEPTLHKTPPSFGALQAELADVQRVVEARRREVVTRSSASFGDFISAVSAAAAQRRRLSSDTFLTQAAAAHTSDVYPNFAHEIRRKCVEAHGLEVSEDVVDVPPAVLNGLVPWPSYQAQSTKHVAAIGARKLAVGLG